MSPSARSLKFLQVLAQSGANMIFLTQRRQFCLLCVAFLLLFHCLSVVESGGKKTEKKEQKTEKTKDLKKKQADTEEQKNKEFVQSLNEENGGTWEASSDISVSKLKVLKKKVLAGIRHHFGFKKKEDKGKGKEVEPQDKTVRKGAFVKCTDHVEFDAREHWKGCAKIIDRIQGQGICGSCWAIATAATFSDRYCIKHGHAIHFSAMDTLTCMPDPDKLSESGSDGGSEHGGEQSAAGHGGPSGGGGHTRTGSSASSKKKKEGNEIKKEDKKQKQKAYAKKMAGCGGAEPRDAWDYISTVGICTEECKPLYKFMDKSWLQIKLPVCQAKCTNTDKAAIAKKIDYQKDKKSSGGPRYWSKYKENSLPAQNPTGIAAAIETEMKANGPVVAGIDVYADFFFYRKGVYHRRKVANPKMGEHAIRLIGWGTQTCTNTKTKAVVETHKFWLGANSWGISWGEKGFVKIRRGVDECGVETEGISFAPMLKYDGVGVKETKTV